MVHVITHLNCPDVYYTPGGQSAPEPSPLDRRMFGRKLRHVGDRVAAVVAESEAIALAALKLIEVEYQVLPAVMNIDEAMAPMHPWCTTSPSSTWLVPLRISSSRTPARCAAATST